MRTTAAITNATAPVASAMLPVVARAAGRRAQPERVVLAHLRRAVALLRRQRIERSVGGSGSYARRAHGGAGRAALVTRGGTALIASAGLRSASETTATITGVIAVAISVPRSQIIGTTTAAATAAHAEITSVWMEIPLFCFSIPLSTSGSPSSRARCRRARRASGPTPCARRRSRRRAGSASPARPAPCTAPSPSGSSPRQTRTKRLVSSSSATVVGSVWPGRIVVSGGSSSSTSMIERLQVLVARAAGRAHAADRALEQRVAGEHVAVDEQRRACPRCGPACAAACTVEAADRRPRSPGFISPVAPGTRLLGVGEHRRVRPALEQLVELGDVVVVVVGEQHVRDGQAVLVGLPSSGSTGPPASTRNASPPGSAATR